MTNEIYKFWDLIGTWLTGLSTLAAVILSLLLSMQRKLNLKISVGIKQLITPGKEETPSYCCVEIVNAGINPANITSIGWKLGFFPGDRIRVQFFNNALSYPLPCMLKQGEQAIFMNPLEENKKLDDWIVRFSKDLLGEYSRLSIKLTMKLYVYTSIGDVFKVKVDKSLIDEILKQAQLVRFFSEEIKHLDAFQSVKTAIPKVSACIANKTLKGKLKTKFLKD